MQYKLFLTKLFLLKFFLAYGEIIPYLVSVVLK
jgi:hypothetical protein